MSFKSLNWLFAAFKTQIDVQRKDQDFQCVLQLWSELVGPQAVAHTRPLTIEQGVLKVATSSAVWAQQLMFKRRQMLVKLNERLSQKLVNIRFTPALWQQSSLPASTETESLLEMWQQHPSRILTEPVDSIETNQRVPVEQNPQEAFQYWRQKIQLQTDSLPLCPQCQCHTPPGELQRWGVCALCAKP